MHYYLLLDGARLEHRLGLGQELNDHNRSLYRGELDPDIEAAGPYLFTFPHNDEFKSWYTNDSAGDHWGVMVMALHSFEELYKHFRRFLMVETEDGKKLYFRFYDPRVLRTFLPTCDTAQLSDFFGPVKYFFAEDEDPQTLLRFSLQNRQLTTERLEKANFFTRYTQVAHSHREEDEKKHSKNPKTSSNSVELRPTPAEAPKRSRRKPPNDINKWLH
jgi:hypothetical protein